MNCDDNVCTDCTVFIYRINKLEEKCNAFKLQLDILHQYKLRQIDENKEISGRVDVHEEKFDDYENNLIEHVHDGFEKCCIRIEKLEKQLNNKKYFQECGKKNE